MDVNKEEKESGYKKQKIKIENVTPTDVLCALAFLSKFPKGSLVGTQLSNTYKVGNSKNCIIAIHKEVVEKMGGSTDAIAYCGPDIIVGEILDQQKGWQSTGEYEIDYLVERVDPPNISKIEQTIKDYYDGKITPS